ncbi:hypothetical protein D2V93_08425 [Flagellimonas taeanensis]|uniref:hypothetical protein n=1 Tax=Flagellimonas taeanensis TaxID=1005926 RepID=UPI000E67B217|nr:hypothetical protein [Allomuricauda taeanensis]RIV50886.1 hypothetical protein D2V93_08425 [Allomuricauda taeanensis]
MIVMTDLKMYDTIEKAKGGKIYNAFMVECPEHNSVKDTKNLKVAINSLGVIQDIHKMNALLEEIGSEHRVDVEIFYIVLEKVINPNANLTEEHRKRFFMGTKKLEELRETISSLSHMSLYFPCEVEYLVLGTSQEEVNALNNQLADEDFKDIFFHHQAYFQKGIMDYEKFISSLREWIAMIKKGGEINKAA